MDTVDYCIVYHDYIYTHIMYVNCVIYFVLLSHHCHMLRFINDDVGSIATNIVKKQQQTDMRIIST